MRYTIGERVWDIKNNVLNKVICWCIKHCYFYSPTKLEIRKKMDNDEVDYYTKKIIKRGYIKQMKNNCPCDIDGFCPYDAEYITTCEWYCGEEEPQDDPEIWEEN